MLLTDRRWVSRRAARSTIITAIVTAGCVASAAVAATPPQSSPAVATESCGALSSLPLPHARIVASELVDGRTGDADVDRIAGARLPRFCRVRGVSMPTARSRIGFEVWLPEGANWSGRLHMVGNGGYSSRIYYAQMIARISAGDVAVATDTGHSGTDLSFGKNNPDAIADFAHRAVHESVVAAKAVTFAYFRRRQSYAYFSGCSTGGYQALSEVQRYPDDFDGVIAGDPGNNRTRLNLAFLWNYLSNHAPGDDRLPLLAPADLLFVNKAVVGACDKLDGVRDGVISDPRQCRFDLDRLKCSPGAHGQCLSDAQIAAMRRIYAGPRQRDTGAILYPGMPYGSEGVEAVVGEPLPGWSAYLQNPGKPGEPQRVDFFRDWILRDPNWRWWSFDWSAAGLAPVWDFARGFDAYDPDLARFRARGGKLIMFMGWADPVGAPQDAIDYYTRVVAHQSGATNAARLAAAQSFAKLYMVPGMAHCAGGPGATHFSSATRDSDPPIHDERHDMAVALEAWVEKGRPPRTLIATHFAGEGPERRIAFQRPICPYPSKPRYRLGPVEKAASFTCARE